MTENIKHLTFSNFNGEIKFNLETTQRQFLFYYYEHGSKSIYVKCRNNGENIFWNYNNRFW